MLAAVGGAPLTRPSLWQLTKLGVKDGMKAGLKTGALQFGTHLYGETYPLPGLKNWAFWLLQSEYLFAEFVQSLPLAKYVSRASIEGLYALVRVLLENVCSEIIGGRYPWLENHILMTYEYFWRGLQGRKLPPAPVNEVPLPATSIAYASIQDWAPVCHPVVEYAKSVDQWTPRMHAAHEVSKWTIPNFSIFFVGACIDVGSYLLGKCSMTTAVGRVWKDFYGFVGGLAGVAAFSSGWAVWSTQLLPLFPKRIQPYIPMIVPQIGMSVGSMLFVNLLFKSIWTLEDDDSRPRRFKDSARLENDRRQHVYGHWNSKFARPVTFAPISPFYIHPELGRLYERTVFPELVPAPVDTEQKPDGPIDDDLDLDDLTKLKLELRKARLRKARELKLDTPVETPVASQHNSSDEEGSSDESDDSSSDDSTSDSEESSETSSSASSDSESESNEPASRGSDESSGDEETGEEADSSDDADDENSESSEDEESD